MYGIRLLQIVLGILAFGFIWSQMVVPQWRGTKWFPIRDRFRKKAAEDLQQARTDVETAEDELAAAQVRKALKKVRDKTSSIDRGNT